MNSKIFFKLIVKHGIQSSRNGIEIVHLIIQINTTAITRMLIDSP